MKITSAPITLAALFTAAAGCASAQTVLTVFASSDVSLRSGTPTATNGTATELLVGTINATSGGSTGADVNGADVSRAYLAFDLNTPGITSALAGQTITSVTLTFTVNTLDSSTTTPSTVSYSLFESGAFNASTVTWSTGRPASVGSSLSSLTTTPSAVTAGSTLTFGSTSNFIAEVTGSVGSTFYVLAKQSTEGTPASRQLLRFRSVDFTGTTSDPVLTITAIPEPSSFAALAGLASIGLVASLRRRRSA